MSVIDKLANTVKPKDEIITLMQLPRYNLCIILEHIHLPFMRVQMFFKQKIGSFRFILYLT